MKVFVATFYTHPGSGDGKFLNEVMTQNIITDDAVDRKSAMEIAYRAFPRSTMIYFWSLHEES